MPFGVTTGSNLQGEVSPVGWTLPDQMTEDEWREAGRALKRLESGCGWWVGDWWTYGEATYGQRKAAVTAEDWDGPGYQACRDAAVVCRKFEMSRRRDSVGFSHHREVAPLARAQADALLDWVEDSGATVRELRARVSKLRVTLGAHPSDTTCTVEDLHKLALKGQRYGCIYADPPWLYDNQGTRASTGNHYDGLTVDQLCELPVPSLSADDAHVHMWTTNAFLFEAPRIFKAWGFEFRSTFVWVKPQMGIGNYWRNSHELLLTGVRGNAKRFNDHSMVSWLECKRGRHSAKPEQVRGMLERASPGPYLELFGRRAADGWTVWGNQIEACDLFRV